MKKQVTIISFLFATVFLGLSCDEEEEKRDWSNEKLFEKDEIIFDCAAKDTVILLNGTLNVNYYFMDVFDDVTSDSVVTYNGFETGEVYGDWFTILVKGNKLNIKTIENKEDHDRQIRLQFFRGGSKPLVVQQRHCQ